MRVARGFETPGNGGPERRRAHGIRLLPQVHEVIGRQIAAWTGDPSGHDFRGPIPGDGDPDAAGRDLLGRAAQKIDRPELGHERAATTLEAVVVHGHDEAGAIGRPRERVAFDLRSACQDRSVGAAGDRADVQDGAAIGRIPVSDETSVRRDDTGEEGE